MRYIIRYKTKTVKWLIDNQALKMITIDMLDSMLYQGKGYVSATRVLKNLELRGYLKCFSCHVTDKTTGRKELIYYPSTLNFNDRRETSVRHMHQYSIIVSELLKMMFDGKIKIKDIQYEHIIDTSTYTKGGKIYKTDCIVIFSYDNEDFKLIIESDKSHYTTPEKVRDLDYYHIMESNITKPDYTVVTLIIRGTRKECEKQCVNIQNVLYLTPNESLLWIKQWLK